MNGYKTVMTQSSVEFTEKKSRFLGYACPVKTEEEAIDFINTIKRKHPDARHNVYAYVVRDRNIQRYSDDGEPQGTAGMPVLDSILKQNLTDVAVVVTRYFGGILLGGGGLVRAYSGTSAMALSEALPVKMCYSKVYRVKVSYPLWGKVEYEIRKLNLDPEDLIYDENVSFSVSVLSSRAESFEKKITEATNGQALIELIDERYAPIKEEE